MEHGPVDVMILAYGAPKFDGSTVRELERLAKEGIIRVLDAMVVLKNAKGEVFKLDIEDLPSEESAVLGFIDTGTRGLFDSDDADTLIEGMVPDSAVAALAIEHTWAIGLKKTLLDAGGEVAMTFRVPAPMIEDALAAIGAE
jgi:hypothetical protein